MAIAAVLAITDEDGRPALFSGKPPAGMEPRKRRTKTWLILENHSGYWVAVAECDYKPTGINKNQRLVREYI